MVIAFDYDSCLDQYKVQLFAKKAISEGNEVWVVTKRRKGIHNVDLLNVLKNIKLPEICVVYTDGKDKAKVVMGLNADLYIDNETAEFDHINNHSNVLALPYL